MQIIDTHCDALYKLQKAKRSEGKLLNFQNAKSLDTNKNRLQTGKVKVQFFAIFLDPDVPANKAWEYAVEQIDLFHDKVIDKHREIKHITNWSQIEKLASDEIGAILTLEGAEPIGNELQKLHQLFKRGIMSVGLTWNQANLCADGVGEPRGAGLSLLGEEVVKLNNKHNVLTDVSHLSVNGFWDVMEQADFPFASHSNSKTICDHPRNLNDDQLKALIKKEAQIHLVFNPPFIKEDRKVTIDDLIKHIDYICSIGGVNNIGFGSDFDGIDEYVVGLEDASKYQELIEELLKHFSELQVRGFAYENFLNYLTHLELN